MTRPAILLALLLASLTAACADAPLGPMRDVRLDPGGDYRPQPDPDTAR